ncbi:MAG: FAD:protein FMN transferase [Bacteroidota bacterium]|nr:FAD:protein FMN transferase [Bacteroidota bacterium]
MSGFLNKGRILSLILVIAIVVVWIFRNSKDQSFVAVEITGQTMGSINYLIKYQEKNGITYKKEIDSLLVAFNQSLSTYIPDSEISQFNKTTIHKFSSPYFYPVLNRSKEIYEHTKGAFDPTIAPLVNAWGFGPDKSREPDSSKLDSLLQLVNFGSIFFDSVAVCKMKAGMMLDLSAIAKGYAVDVIASFLKSKNIENLMVEIGGEVICYGKNERGETWAIGIDDPTGANGKQPKAILQLENRAIATSGNYRNFYEIDGIRYSHTISPFTGFPVQHNLLSASVFAEDCMTADAYATAFMVLGVEESLKILNNDEKLDAHLIYSVEKGDLQSYTTEGIKPYFIK